MNCAESKSKRVGIIQSNYIPWKGYFDFIDSVDEFVLLDDVQFTRRDWRNRNKIKTRNGLQWLTIPVAAKGKYFQRIEETEVAGSSWIDEHLAALRHAYARAPFFSSEWAWVQDAYEQCRSIQLLSTINERLLTTICTRLGIATPIRRSREFDLVEGKNERLIAICRQIGATHYLSGPAAGDYMALDEWNAAGLSVSFKSYAGYPEYPQLHGPFEHGVSILDVVFNTGPDAYRYCKSEKETA